MNQSVYENVGSLTSFTCKTAAKFNWHRDGTKLRNCHPMYISFRRWTRATRCRQRWTFSVINWPSNVASIVNLVRPTTVRFIALTVHLCRVKLTTRCDDRRAVANFLSPKFGTKFQREACRYFWRSPNFRERSVFVPWVPDYRRW